ncbi:epimerase, partial [Enterococcus faecalis]|nr:epimerase [Enterococcus faecalis]
MESFLITGGAGFIGSTLANYYSKDNQVVVIDGFSV